MEENEEPSSTFNINLITGDVTVSAGNEVPVVVNRALQCLPVTNQMLPPSTPDVPSSSKTFTGKAKPPSKVRSKESLEKDSDEYVRRRQRNNVAVKKSREKTREKSVYTTQKVDQLKEENEQLESKITILTKELGVLKDLFMDHARGFCAGGNMNMLPPEQLEFLLGCKVIKKNNIDSNTDAGTSGASTSNGVQGGLSTFEPLINVAEIELRSFQDNEVKSTVTQTEPSSSNIGLALQHNFNSTSPSDFQQKDS